MRAQVFDKALGEPGFSEIYATLCFDLNRVLPTFKDEEGEEVNCYPCLCCSSCIPAVSLELCASKHKLGCLEHHANEHHAKACCQRNVCRLLLAAQTPWNLPDPPDTSW